MSRKKKSEDYPVVEVVGDRKGGRGQPELVPSGDISMAEAEWSRITRPGGSGGKRR